MPVAGGDVGHRRTAARGAVGGRTATLPEREPVGAPDAKRGKVAIEQYACLTCHRIPGPVGEQAPVGPPLDRIATRRFIAGGAIFFGWSETKDSAAVPVDGVLRAVGRGIDVRCRPANRVARGQRQAGANQ